MPDVSSLDDLLGTPLARRLAGIRVIDLSTLSQSEIMM
jgi:hypothetical protein